MPNANRQRRIASMLIRHYPVLSAEGRQIGCLCGLVGGRVEHTKHVARIVDQLIDDALDSAFAAHDRFRNSPA